MRMGTPIETRIEERQMPETIFGNLRTRDGTEFVDAYRYQLYRGERSPLFDDKPKSDKALCFVMLNPSTADATKDDPTIKRCRGYAVRWGYQHLYIVNLFAYRATDPKDLYKSYSHDVDIGGPENDDYILGATKESDCIIAAWGAIHPAFEWRASQVCKMLRKNYLGKVHALGLTKAGHPRHPLYLKKHAKPFLFLFPWKAKKPSYKKRSSAR